MKNLIALSLSLFIVSFSLMGQDVVGKKKKIVKNKSERVRHSDSNIKFVPLPYANYSRSIGFMGGAVPFFQFNPIKNDTLSPLSTIGMLGLYSANKSWGAGAFGLFYLKEDTWRITTGAGTGSLNFQFFLNMLDLWIPYDAKANFSLFSIKRKLIEDLYGGISYTYTKIVTNFADLPIDAKTTLQSIGLHLTLDTRDNVYNPTRGTNSKLEFSIYPNWLGNEFISKNIDLEYDQFIPIKTSNDVLAIRFYGGIGIGELSFNQQFVMGGSDLRGYTQGKYRGDNMFALQAEYRWNPFEKYGFVGFAGIASVMESINKEDNGKILSGVGVGFRYVLIKETGIRVGIDGAVGKDDWGVYFRIGEAF